MFFKLYTGLMGSGKSDFILQDIKKYSLINNKDNYLVLNSLKGFREEGLITSRNGSKHRAIGISTFEDIITLLELPRNSNINHIFLDEAQFLQDIENVNKVIQYLFMKGIDITISGLEINCYNKSFPIIGELACYADEIIKLKATCSLCNNVEAKRIIRYIDSKLDIDYNSEVLLVDTDNKHIEYHSVCRACYLQEVNKIQNYILESIV